MEFKKGDLFENAKGPIFVTTSAFINPDGSLMMNRGAAANCTEKHPEVGKIFGEMAKKYGVPKRNEVGNKFLRFGTLYDVGLKVGVFQVKYHFKDDVDIHLLRYSTSILAGLSRVFGPVNMNFPGCGYGRVTRNQVMNILDDLLDKEDVIIWRLDASEYEDDIGDVESIKDYGIKRAVENASAFDNR